MRKSLFTCLVLLSSSYAIGQNPEINSYIENPSMYAEGQEPAHVPYVAFDDVSGALEGNWDNSPYYQSLEGQWDFKWSKRPEDVPVAFFETTYQTDKWNKIQVPATWQMEGYGYNVYRNIPLEFNPYDPPFVPDHFNPTGCYVRNFEIPDTWEGRKIKLHFNGVKSAYWVWVNGKYVGFDKGSMTSGEFDITKYIRKGGNKLAVKVVRWSDGTYLEDQDMWRFAGIYRDVYLHSVPEVNIADFHVISDLDDQFQNGELHIKGTVKNESSFSASKLMIRATLYNKQQQQVVRTSSRITSLQSGEVKTAALKADIKNPKKWMDESPYLYTMILELMDSKGKVIEILEEKVGFRNISIKDKVLYVNGIPVKMRGVNRHEHDLNKGRTMSRDLIIKDLKLMKQLNVNAIRLSHYPNDPMFYDLADEYGFFVCDEVNAECHYGENFLAAQDGWETAFMDRTTRMVEQNKNHPSIIIWSTGNECGYAPIHEKMAEYIKKTDPTRMIMHQGNQEYADAPFADINGTRYPSPELLELLTDSINKPVIMGEYAHNIGNSLGHFDEYWNIINVNEQLQGGYIWDWVNQGLELPLIQVNDRSEYEHMATVMGRPELVSGKEGKALAFSGMEDYIELNNHVKLDVEKLAIDFWIKPRGWQNTNHLMGKGESYGFVMSSSDKLTFYVTTKAGRKEATTDVPKNWNQNWHQVNGSYDGTSLKLSINNKVMDLQAHSGRIKRDFAPFTVGKNHTHVNEMFTGFTSSDVFDEVRIYSDTDQTDENLVLYLPCDELHDTGKKFEHYGATPNASGTMDGVVNTDRSLQPEAYQLKKSHSPIGFKIINAGEGLFSVENRHSVTNLNEYKIAWQLLVNGEEINKGKLQLDLPAQRSREVSIPYHKSIPEDDTKSLLLRLTACLKEVTPWAEAGYEIAFEEFDLTKPQVKKEIIAGDKVVITLQNDHYLIAGPNFLYKIIKATGQLDMNGFIGPSLTAWRSPIQNERSLWGEQEMQSWYAAGLDILQHKVTSIQQSAIGAALPQVKVISLSRASEEPLISFVNEITYIFANNGSVEVESTITPRTDPDVPLKFPEIKYLPRLGLEFALPLAFQKVAWYGKGPFETYPDRKTGAKTGWYEQAIDNIRMPYLVPQDFGNHTEVRQLKLIGLEKKVDIFFDRKMNFAINPYENLSTAHYAFQLDKAEAQVLFVGEVSGVGGTSIQTRPEYRVYPAKTMIWLKLMPLK